MSTEQQSDTPTGDAVNTPTDTAANTPTGEHTPEVVRWDRDADGIVTLTIDDPSSSANTMNAAYTESMARAVDRLEAERDDLLGVVITSAKKTFFAGGNLSDMLQIGPEQAAQIFAKAEQVKGQLRRLETLGRPVVAALGGTALGGGFEIALACHRRIAVDDPALKVGLPEVTLGLLPGGGGVTRMVRMLGLQAALMEWLLTGAQRSARTAYDKGLIDELVATRDDLVPAAKAWLRAHGRDDGVAVKAWDTKGFRLPGGSLTSPAVAQMLPAFPANLRKQLKGADIRAPKAIMAVAVEGAQVDFDTASRIESRYFTSLVTGRGAKAMIQAFFFDLQAISSGALRPAGIERQAVTSVGVVGAGMMGAGIAHACASVGIEVQLKDVDLAAAERGKEYAAKVVGGRVAKGRMSEEQAAQILARIHPTETMSDLAGVDVVIEAVFESHSLKESVFADIEAVVGPDTLLCSNTSTLPITSLQAATSRPADFVGLHFFSPVDKMRLVEIIRGRETGDAAVARAVDLVQQLRKTPIVVSDGRGFYTSRVYGTLITEATQLVGEGVDPMVVERAATMAGFPAPPLAMLDEVSLSLSQSIRKEAAKAAAAEGRELPTTAGTRLIDAMVDDHGRKGRAAGAGFYDYPADGPKTLWPGVREHFTTGTAVPMRDIQDRYLFIMALEAAKCFEEGVLHDTASANIGAIFGIGYPPATGGPATFMTNREGGLAAFVARADELADAYGERFRPSPWLRERADIGSLV